MGMKPRIFVEHEGKLVTVKILGGIIGIPYGTMKQRYQAGDRGPRLVRPLRPLRSTLTVEIAGVPHTLHELSKITGVKYNTLRYRHIRGLRGKVLVAPAHKPPGPLEGPPKRYI